MIKYLLVIFCVIHLVYNGNVQDSLGIVEPEICLFHKEFTEGVVVRIQTEGPRVSNDENLSTKNLNSVLLYHCCPAVLANFEKTTIYGK